MNKRDRNDVHFQKMRYILLTIAFGIGIAAIVSGNWVWPNCFFSQVGVLKPAHAPAFLRLSKKRLP